MDENKRNLQDFEAPSVRELFAAMQAWQVDNNQRFHSLHVEHDAGSYCCIALTNPTEVIIKDGYFSGGVNVSNNKLSVSA